MSGLAEKRARQVDFEMTAVAVLAFLSFFKVYVLPDGVRQGMRLCFALLVILYVISRFDRRHLANPSIPFCIAIALGCVHGYRFGWISAGSASDGLFFAMVLYLLSCIVKIYSLKGEAKRLVDVFFWLTCFYCVCSIASMLIVGRSDSTSLLYYFAGNKFGTSYLFIQFAALGILRRRIAHDRQMRRFDVGSILGCLVAVGVAMWLYCTTAVVASLALLVFSLLPSKARAFFMNSKVLVAAIVLSAGILLFLQTLLEIPIVYRVIVDLLGESSSLTGRTRIYDILAFAVAQSPVFGYGYGNAVISSYVGYGNAQNGLLEIVMQYGFVGALAFFVSVLLFLRGARTDRSWGGYLLVYAMVVAAVVEVSYGPFFFFGLMMIFVIEGCRDGDAGCVEGEVLDDEESSQRRHVAR